MNKAPSEQHGSGLNPNHRSLCCYFPRLKSMRETIISLQITIQIQILELHISTCGPEVQLRWGCFVTLQQLVLQVSDLDKALRDAFGCETVDECVGESNLDSEWVWLYMASHYVSKIKCLYFLINGNVNIIYYRFFLLLLWDPPNTRPFSTPAH